MFKQSIIQALTVTGFALLPTWVAAFDQVDPAEVGFDPDKVAGIAQMLDRDVAEGRILGGTVSILRNDRLALHHATGKRTPDGPNQEIGDIFRIFSMTKPIVSVAAMILVERGHLELDAPLSQYIPEFADTKLIEVSGLYEPEREITVRDLLRHTSGIVYGFFGDTFARDEYKKHNLLDTAVSTGDHARLIARLPLEHEPGAAWEYGRSTDVLGHVIEVVSGQRLDQFLQAEVLDPLNMIDTAFFVPQDKDDRIALPGQQGFLFDPMIEPAYHSGGSGLMSTAPDYLQFVGMLLNGGELDGVRILKPETVADMGRDQLIGVRPGNYDLLGDENTFGLGFAVRQSEAGTGKGSVGDMWWGGFAGTYFWIDPAQDMAVVFMIQNPEQREYYRPVLRNTVYEALTGN
ncbi:serine hydrolase domain-containing protein [Falsiruegeria mediterranea]